MDPVKPAEYDDVDRPRHYSENKNIEPIEVIEDWDLGHHLACAIKYISRYKLKEQGGSTRDLQKAVWYLSRKITNDIWNQANK